MTFEDFDPRVKTYLRLSNALLERATNLRRRPKMRWRVFQRLFAIERHRLDKIIYGVIEDGRRTDKI